MSSDSSQNTSESRLVARPKQSESNVHRILRDAVAELEQEAQAQPGWLTHAVLQSIQKIEQLVTSSWRG